MKQAEHQLQKCNPKELASSLKAALDGLGVKIKLSTAKETVARVNGLGNWRTIVAMGKQGRLGHDVILVNIDNGDAAAWLDGEMIAFGYCDDDECISEQVGEIASNVAKALGCTVREINMPEPADKDWNWNDVRAIVGLGKLNAVEPITVHDPIAKVLLPGSGPEKWEQWHISQNLTDRWGDLNYHNALNKPLEPLEDESDLVQRLREQMWEESTFIVRKDGEYGILFEEEYCSIESEEGHTDGTSVYKPHEDVVKILLSGLKDLEPRFPGVLFAVPEKVNIVNERPAVWAFVKDGLLNEDQRNELGVALLSL